MNHVERDKRAYDLAWKYLLSLKREGVTAEVVEEYLSPEPRPRVLAGVYLHILESAKNANRKENVIGKVEKLRPILCDFQPKSVVKKYGTDWARVFDEIKRELK